VRIESHFANATPPPDRDAILRTIEALEGQRGTLGDSAVDLAITPLRARLAEGEASGNSRASKVGAERKVVTVLFVDVAGFTGMSERIGSEATHDVVNSLFESLVPLVERYGGVVDKFIGDEIMAVFGAPRSVERHAEHALRAALAMFAALDEYNRSRGLALALQFDRDLFDGTTMARLAAQRGQVLPERGYPVRRLPESSPVEAAFALGIIRQESGFDARIKSSVGARGMMQLMPSTAKVLAKRAGVRRFRDSMLDDADFNMRLGSSYLGGLVNQFDGSYIMAAAAYNAGPGRPSSWMNSCGDPRAAKVDPVDYIECIPIGETRNYVMRVLENVEVRSRATRRAGSGSTGSSRSGSSTREWCA